MLLPFAQGSQQSASFYEEKKNNNKFKYKYTYKYKIIYMEQPGRVEINVFKNNTMFHQRNLMYISSCIHGGKQYML